MLRRFNHYIACWLLLLPLAGALYPQSFNITVNNPSDLNRPNSIVEINLDFLKPASQAKNFSVMSGGVELQSEYFAKYKNGSDYLLVMTDLVAGETKKLTVKVTEQPSSLNTKYTGLYLAERTDTQKVGAVYQGGAFKSVTRTKIHANHTVQDAYYQYEGLGWESDKIAYRLYLDVRNKIDIFGKRTSAMMLPEIGKNDFVPNQESYQKLQDWGMDIFKVGPTVGLAGLHYYKDGKPLPISNTDSTICALEHDGKILSRANMHYYGSLLNGEKNDIFWDIQIKAHSRLVKNHVEVDKDMTFCAGLPKHAGTQFMKSDMPGSKWQYIGIYGKQTLNNDNLGIALFYRASDLVELKEDEYNQLAALKTDKGVLTYFFCAAWELEPDGIKTQSEFERYLNAVVTELNNKLIINYEHNN